MSKFPPARPVKTILPSPPANAATAGWELATAAARPATATSAANVLVSARVITHPPFRMRGVPYRWPLPRRTTTPPTTAVRPSATTAPIPAAVQSNPPLLRRTTIGRGASVVVVRSGARGDAAACGGGVAVSTRTISASAVEVPELLVMRPRRGERRLRRVLPWTRLRLPDPDRGGWSASRQIADIVVRSTDATATRHRVPHPRAARGCRGRTTGVGGRQEGASPADAPADAGEEVSTDRLIDALWGERPPPTASNSLHVRVSRLRRELGDDVLVRGSTGYALRVEDKSLDLRRFERLVGEGRERFGAGDARRGGGAAQAALALWART